MAKQKQITEQILKETEKLKAISDAEREKAVKSIHIQQKIEVRIPLSHTLAHKAAALITILDLIEITKYFFEAKWAGGLCDNLQLKTFFSLSRKKKECPILPESRIEYMRNERR